MNITIIPNLPDKREANKDWKREELFVKIKTSFLGEYMDFKDRLELSQAEHAVSERR